MSRYKQQATSDKPRSMPKTKVCTKCGKRKRLGEYYARKTHKDGKRYDCKECSTASVRRWQAEHRERKAATDAAWYAKNREHKAATKAAWYVANKARAVAQACAWQTRNREWCNVRNQLRRIGGF